MLVKLLIFACVAYLAYRLLVGPPLLKEGKPKRPIDQEPDDEDYTDFEEID